ncbi:hypothetical protein [Bosea sp. 117]|uniref:hypothetical protein n=1 Tax=Bosea sp. 117 TaxID=1125973 RepID=UPI0004947DB8|nr:hypothetical protein [Bosea sp. 117]
MIATVPLLIIPLVIYNMLAFLTPGLGWEAVLISIPMVSSARLDVTIGDVFVLMSLVFLFLEIVKATSASTRSIIDHMLSTLVFVAALVEFILVDVAATSTFLILIALMLLDIVAGYSVSIRVARRDFAIEPRAD